MAKEKTVYICSECGHKESKWAGRCVACGSWNTFTEESIKTKLKFSSSERNSEPVALSRVTAEEKGRIDCGSEEMNRVLGGGLTADSSVLLGGRPGIGKSTLLLQTAAAAKVSSILYVSGEESASQIKSRADRLDINPQRITLFIETDLEKISSAVRSVKPELLIVDSIQTVVCKEAGIIPGTVNQLKFSACELVSVCKEIGAALFLTAHVTKEGVIAGPKLLEHLVDTVLYFEDGADVLRILRAEKNRFGAVDELGLFTMEENGLKEVENPSCLFTVSREGALPAGVACAMIMEGSRMLPIEIQALVTPAQSSLSRVFSDKIDGKRVSRIAAVLEKHAGMKFSDRDLYVNVAGGMRLNEPAADLALAVALHSSRTGIPVPRSVILAGELSLAGEVRPVRFAEKREKAALKAGYGRFIGPRRPDQPASSKNSPNTVSDIGDCIRKIFRAPDENGSPK